MSGYLTTHVLDTAKGVPAADLKIELYRINGQKCEHLAEMITNKDGRTNAPILAQENFATGQYELIFHCGDYLRRDPAQSNATGFLDQVPIRFLMSDETHYHVPLLLSPYGYSTYRGS